MTLPRQITVPIVLALSLIALLAAFLTTAKATIAYHSYEHFIPKAAMPAFSLVFEPLSPAGWLLPFLTIGAAIPLIRRPQCSAVYLAWYVSAIILLILVWVGATYWAVDLMNMSKNYAM